MGSITIYRVFLLIFSRLTFNVYILWVNKGIFMKSRAPCSGIEHNDLKI
jgi:hypothetical protein